jgi:hypothetical protein
MKNQLNLDEQNVKSVKTDILETFLSESGKEIIKSDTVYANATFKVLWKITGQFLSE